MQNKAVERLLEGERGFLVGVKKDMGTARDSCIFFFTIRRQYGKI